MINLFLDANILIDIVDSNRPNSEDSAILFKHLMQNQSSYKLFTSCDLMTTVYYILRKELTNDKVLKSLKIMNTILSVVEFGNDDIDKAIELMQSNKNFKDFEDTIQYIIAKKSNCKYIISNDKKFYSLELPILSSSKAINTFF